MDNFPKNFPEIYKKNILLPINAVELMQENNIKYKTEVAGKVKNRNVLLISCSLLDKKFMNNYLRTRVDYFHRMLLQDKFDFYETDVRLGSPLESFFKKHVSAIPKVTNMSKLLIDALKYDINHVWHKIDALVKQKAHSPSTKWKDFVLLYNLRKKQWMKNCNLNCKCREKLHQTQVYSAVCGHIMHICCARVNPDKCFVCGKLNNEYIVLQFIKIPDKIMQIIVEAPLLPGT